MTKSESSRSPSRIGRLGSFALKAILWLVASVFSVWAFGALRYDLPSGGSICSWMFISGLIVLLCILKSFWRKLAAISAACSAVLLWWLTLQPRNDREWQPDVEQMAWAEINGDMVTLHNVRNCDYRTETDFTPHWETRTVNLSHITGVDLFINYWGSPWMAHPIASFQFSDSLPICFSIETRKEKGESYSAIGGLYRQYELTYVAADERDVIRLRTNFRKGEESYLYRTKVTPARARERFMEYVTTINSLRDHPRWYNALTTNCTTAIRTQRPASQRLPWDWRLLVNGKGDELLYEKNLVFTGGLGFQDLRAKACINDAAHEAGWAADFSRIIRAGRPGFESADAGAGVPQSGKASPAAADSQSTPK